MTIIETNLKFNSNYSDRNGNPEGFALHHAAANGSVQDVHNWHLARGWAGIGYHFYVRKDGSVYRGRPENWIGAHTSGHNSKIGICAEGNFDVEQMGAAQKNAIIELLEYLYDKYGRLKVYGHRDLDATACPGNNYPFEDIVNGKKGEIAGPPAEPEAVILVVNILRRGDENEQVKTAQRLLMARGYDLGTYRDDGDYGALTEAAVLKFQRDNGLKENGTVDSRTWCCLLSASVYAAKEEDPIPDTETAVDSKHLYRVQVGAFHNRAYAEDYLEKVRSAGFPDAFITES